MRHVFSLLFLVFFSVLTAQAQVQWKPMWGASPMQVQNYLQSEPGWDKIIDQPLNGFRTVGYSQKYGMMQLVMQFEKGKLVSVREMKRTDEKSPIPDNWETVEVGYLDKAQNAWIVRRYEGGFRIDDYSRITAE